MTTYQIILENKSGHTEQFFLFQEPAKYTGGAETYSNSIYKTTLRSGTSQDIITIQQQYKAGVQEQAKNIVIGQPSGQKGDIKNVDITPATGAPKDNLVNVLLDPLGLSEPESAEGVQAGAFRITTPVFNPNLTKINVGLAVKCDEKIVLSNFVMGKPNRNVDCQPVVLFYLNVGSYLPGDVINFSESSRDSAVCDATNGYTNFKVTYLANGTWNVEELSDSAFATLQRKIETELV